MDLTNKVMNELLELVKAELSTTQITKIGCDHMSSIGVIGIPQRKQVQPAPPNSNMTCPLDTHDHTSCSHGQSDTRLRVRRFMVARLALNLRTERKILGNKVGIMMHLHYRCCIPTKP